MSKYDWSGVPSWVNWLATEKVHDKYITWGYFLKPKMLGGIWSDIESGGNPKLIGYDLFKGDWKDSLEERPND